MAEETKKPEPKVEPKKPILCVCDRACQVRNEEGYIVTYDRGAIDHFYECPKYFRPLEGDGAAAIDFDVAEEAELMTLGWEVEDMQLYIRSKYKKVTKISDKVALVKMLLDLRFRALG